MALALNVLRCPEGVALDRREVTAEEFSIGRGTDNDWVLPDPDKVLSKRHCHLTAQGGRWLLADSSSNGTLLNGSALDRGALHPLRDRDRLTLGRYELEVRIGDRPPEDDPGEAVTRFGVRPPGLEEPRLTGDPFPPLAGDPLDAPVPSLALAIDFDALGAGDAVSEHPYPRRDDAPAFDMPFQPPRPSTELLPPDWDLDVDPAPPAPAPPAGVAPATAAPEAPPLPPAPTARPAPPAPAAIPDADGAARAGLSAFSAGAGIASVAPGDPVVVLRGLGAAFRAIVSGLRQSMIARAAVKNEFRISQTMIRPSGNNPLKFAADDDDALSALLGVGRFGSLDPEAALADALRDIQTHELAVASAMQTAVRDLLAELAPDKVGQGVRRTALRWHKGAAWDAYVARHAEVSRALTDEFDSVFGRSFARAYEAALNAVASKDDL